MKYYKVLLLTPDGEDYQLEGSECKTIEEASEVSADMGSRWIFYPFHFIIRDVQNNGYYKGSEVNNKRILETPYGLEFFKGLSVKTVRNYFKNNSDFVEALLS